MEEFTGNTEENASGYVIEVNLDSRRGILATLLIKNGSIKKGMTVVVENSMCSTRIIENYLGKNIDSATFSSPIRIVGFDKMPRVGAQFKTFEKKSDATEYTLHSKEEEKKDKTKNSEQDQDKKIIPIILKADVSGSIEAIEKEITKIKNDTAEFRVVGKGIGPISESDIKGISSDTDVFDYWL